MVQVVEPRAPSHKNQETDMQKPIDLRRVTSPLLSEIDEGVSQTLAGLRERWQPSTELRQHRRLGTERDRHAAAAFLAARYGKQIDPDRILLANGTQNALLLLLSALVPRGGTVLVEAMTYRQIRDVAAMLGLNLVSVALDEDGLLPDAFEAACRLHRPSVLYCIPTVQNPSASIMSAERRQVVANIARRHGVAIIEDEAQGLIPRDAPAPIGSIAPDITWSVTGLSKCLAVGLRIAYVVAPSAAILHETIATFEDMAFWYVSAVSAALLLHHIESGAAFALTDAVQREAQHRQEVAARLLPSTILKSGHGLHIWLSYPGVRGDEARAAAFNAGVLVRSASEYSVDGDRDLPGIRVSLADVSREDLIVGLTLLSGALSPPAGT